jgi:hypothetical protein
LIRLMICYLDNHYYLLPVLLGSEIPF